MNSNLGMKQHNLRANNNRWVAPMVVLLILALSVTGCITGSNYGSGNIVTENRRASNFDSIFIRGEGTIFLTQGDETAIAVETDDNLTNKVYTQVREKTLELSYASGPFGTHLQPSTGYVYHITVVDLESISIEGSAEVFADEVVAEQLELAVTGSGQIEIADLNSDEVQVDITGSGEIDLSGEVATQNIMITGEGTFDGHDLKGEYVQVNTKGDAKATVWATVDLDISVAGGGDVQYYGDVVPDMNNGSGTVQSLGVH